MEEWELWDREVRSCKGLKNVTAFFKYIVYRVHVMNVEEGE